ncbi:MAG: competence/damage-inducible protein A [Neomegalonema sp.]|nr:competence/damage-inducible protein A [Neomegalonema sp.]
MDEASLEAAQPTAAIIAIGDEILSGRIHEGNGHVLAQFLAGIGVRMVEMRVIPDDHATIVASVRELAARVDHLFTSGGIGPTHDDITAEAVAEAMGAPIGVRDDARAILEAYYGQDGINEARLRMARIPDGALLIDNPVSRAPGFTLANVHVLAGVPIVFKEMLESLRPSLKGGPVTLSWSIRSNAPEGDLAAGLAEIDSGLPDVTVGVYPFYRGGLGSTVVLRSVVRSSLESAVTRVRALCQERGATQISETPPEQ